MVSGAREMIDRIDYVPVGDLIALMLCVLLLVGLFESYVDQTINFKIFLLGILVVGLSASCRVILYQLIEIRSVSPEIFIILKSIYKFCICCILELYIIYIMNMVAIRSKLVLLGSLWLNFICLFADIIYGKVSMFNIFEVYSIPSMLSYVGSVILCIALIYRFHMRILKQLRICLIVSAFYAVLVVLIGACNHNDYYYTISFLFPIIMVMLLSHANSYSVRTGALGRESFENFLGKNKKCTLGCLKFYMHEKTALPKEVEIKLRNFWDNYLQNVKLFSPNGHTFVLVIYDEDVNEQLGKLVSEKLEVEYKLFGVDYRVISFEKENNCKDYKEFLRIVEYLEKKTEMNTFGFFKRDELKELDQENALLQELKDIYKQFDYEDPRVLPYYQPIKNMKTNCYDTAECLMRLHLPDEGLIFPQQFIYLIEREDLMHRFSMIMLHKVCQSLKKFTTLQRISVNFSIAELKHKDFVEDFKRVIEQNHISYDKIGVEFTESNNDSDFEIIKHVVGKLRALGCTVYLDDFGTGYSNFDRLLGLNMNVVKFDRSLLLLAETDTRAKTILHSFSEAFLELDFEILYEGVETPQQENLCICEGHADYLQGYKYSKPIAEQEFALFLQQNSSNIP